MKSRLPTALIAIALLQWGAIICLPLQTLQSITPMLWVLIAVLFAALGLFLLRRRAWARLATIFVQGFNIIVRLLILMPNVATKTAAGTVQVNGALLATFVVSMALSAVVLYYIDQPDIQMLMA